MFDNTALDIDLEKDLFKEAKSVDDPNKLNLWKVNIQEAELDSVSTEENTV